MKLPFGSLQEKNPAVSLPIKAGDTWRVNFSRVQYLHLYDQPYPAKIPQTPCEDWIWQSTDTGDLHNPELWGRMIFSDLEAGTVTDQVSENAFALRRRPPPPKSSPASMVYLAPCTCTIGPDPTDPQRSPAHQVGVEGFWMDTMPVTVGQFAAFLNQGDRDRHYSTWMRLPERCGIVRRQAGCYEVAPGRADYPLVYVDYEAALAFAESQGKTLPSEIEWERAVRGPEGRTYAWGDEAIIGSSGFDLRFS